MREYVVLMLFMSLGLKLKSQDTIHVSNSKESYNKGSVSFYWGWNRSFFSKSDISFTGANYGFTLHKVRATDRPTPFVFNIYFNPKLFSIPQTNFKLGYFISDKYQISFGIDHMKYVIIQDQEVGIDGEIDVPKSGYNGNYEDTSIILAYSFLKFEHTNGLNYVNFSLKRFDRIPLPLRFVSVSLIEGFEAGALVPRSDVKLLNYEERDEFHLAGYGANALFGLNISLWKYFFIQSEVKGGFIHLPDILTTMLASERARQHFFFLQNNIVFGCNIPLVKR